MKKKAARQKDKSSPDKTIMGVQLTSRQAQHLKQAAALVGVTRNEMVRAAALERATQIKNISNKRTRTHVAELARFEAEALYAAIRDKAVDEAEKSGLPGPEHEDDYSPQNEFMDSRIQHRIGQFAAAFKACGPELSKLIIEELKNRQIRGSGGPKYLSPEDWE